MLRAQLIELGYDAIGYLSIDDVSTRLSLTLAEIPAIIILDLNDAEITRSQSRQY